MGMPCNSSIWSAHAGESEVHGHPVGTLQIPVQQPELCETA